MVGTDYGTTYKEIFNFVYVLGYHFEFSRENLYKLLNRLAMFYTGSDYVGVFALSSLLVCGFVFIALRTQSKDFSYGVLLFVLSGFYFWSFNGVRQAIAMSIFIYASRFIQERKPIKYVIWIIIASGFHTIALVYFPIYFINRFKINLRILAIFTVICVFFSELLLQFSYRLTSNIGILNVYASRYFGSAKYETSTQASWTHALINAAFFILYIWISRTYDKNRQESNIWINFQALALILSLMFRFFPVATRLSRLFEVMWILSVPCMTRLIKNRQIRIFVNIGIIACLSLYVYVTFFVLGYHNVLPYQTIFDR